MDDLDANFRGMVSGGQSHYVQPTGMNVNDARTNSGGNLRFAPNSEANISME